MGGDQPFYVGDWVVAVDALPGSTIKNGKTYQVTSCDFANGYWYVGVPEAHNRLRPSIFAPMEAKFMAFEKLFEMQPVHQS